MFELSTFKTYHERGFLSPNKFSLMLVPVGVGVNTLLMKYAYQQSRAIQFSCKSATLPNIAFNTAEYVVNGVYRRHALDRDYDPFKAEFYVDNDMRQWEFFKDWCDNIFDPKTRQFSYPSEYFSLGNLLVYDGKNKKQKEILFHKMWPQIVGEIRFDWEEENKVAIFPVIFKYSYFSVDGDFQKTTGTLPTNLERG